MSKPERSNSKRSTVYDNNISLLTAKHLFMICPLIEKKNSSWKDKETATVQKPLQPMFAQTHPDVPRCFYKNVLWTDETNTETFSINTQRYN